MADMLVVATFKVSNPVLFFVKVKADNPFLHVPAKRQAPTSPIRAVMEPRGGEPHGAVFKKNKEIGWGETCFGPALCTKSPSPNSTYSAWHERLTSERKFGLLPLCKEETFLVSYANVRKAAPGTSSDAPDHLLQ
jgi:hypothetical protein